MKHLSIAESFQYLETHISKRLSGDNQSIEQVLLHFKHHDIERNEFLLRQGENCKNVYFIVKGCLQIFVYDSDSNEVTRDIIIEDNWCSDLISFGSGQPALENIRAVEKTTVLAINQESFRTLVQTVPQFDLVYKQILEASYANSVYRINSFAALSAIERIQWLMNYRQGLMSRLSSKLIASYLGISQETFSRLKSKI